MSISIKQQEFIFAVEADLFKAFNGFVPHPDLETLLTKLLPYTIAAQRAGLETNTNYLQLIPYCYVYETGFQKPTEYLLYQRTKKVGEERLGGKFSIGVGGHIDLSDYIKSNQDLDGKLSLVSLLQQSIKREIEEETGVKCQFTRPMLRDSFVGLIVDREDAVNKVHLGMVFAFDGQTLLKDTDTAASDRVRITEPELIDKGYVTIDKLGDYDTESWAKLIVEHLRSL